MIRKRLVYHELLVLCVCAVSLVFGLPHIIHSGIYIFQLMDYYAASLSITYLAFFEIVAIAWFYGVDRLSKNIKQMTGAYYLNNIMMIILICTINNILGVQLALLLPMLCLPVTCNRVWFIYNYS